MAFLDEIKKHQRQRSVYLDFSVANNPGVDWEGAVSRLYGTAYDDLGPIPIVGTVTSFGTFARSVLTMERDLETPSVTVELIDDNNEWRRLAEPPSTQLLYRWALLMMRVIDDAGTLFDQKVAVGQITDPTFPAGKKVSLTLQLTPGVALSEMIPRRLVSMRDFPRCPPENAGKVVPVIYGVMSNSVRTAVVSSTSEGEPGSSGCGTPVWTDTFDSAAALTADYTVSGAIQKVAGAGVGGSTGVQTPSGLNGTLQRVVDIPGRSGCCSAQVKPTAGNSFSWAILLDDSSSSAGMIEVYPSASGVVHADLTGQVPTVHYNSGSGVMADGVFSTVSVEWQLSTWTGPGASDHAADGYLRVFVNGALVINQNNIEVHHEAARQTVVDRASIRSIFISTVGAVFDNFEVSGAGEETEPTTTTVLACTPTDTGSGPNMASGAVRALLVDTGITTAITVQNPAPEPGGLTIDTSIEQMGTAFANERIGSGSINVPTFYYVAPMVGSNVGPLSSIMDLDQGYDPDYPAHDALVSWNDITTTPDQWIVWMFTDPNFHPVSNPEPGARVRIIPGTPYTDPDYPPANTYDYQVVFTSVDDGDPWQTFDPGPVTVTGFSGYRYLLAGHTLHRVNEVYVLRPVAVPAAEEGADPVTQDMQVLQQEGTDFVQEIVEINGSRYHMLHFFAAMQSDDCTTQYEVTANVEGVETNADGTGELITNGMDMVEHILLNWVFNNYRSSTGIYAPPGGRWFTDVPYSPGLVDHSSFLAAYENAFTFVIGGYLGAGMMTEQVTGTQLVTDLMRSFGLDFYFDPMAVAALGNGAWAVKLFQPDLVARGTQTIFTPNPPSETGYVGINSGTFALSFERDWHHNVVQYFAGPMSGKLADSSTNQDGGYTASGEVRDPESIQAYGLVTRDPLYLLWTRDPETAYSVAYRLLRLGRYPPLVATCSTPLSALTVSPASEVAVTHPDGSGLTGWTNRICRVERLDVNFADMTCQVTLRDVDGLVP